MTRKIKVEGQRFGRLVVVDEAPPHIVPSGQAKRRVVCLCDCGERRVVHVSSLRSGGTQSCGCYHVDQSTRHGLHGTRTYRIWAGMVRRGTGKNTVHNYGDRGIDICKRWLSFENFVSDMGECPPNLTIERLDNNRGYSPDNCEWKTFKEQQRNKRTNRHIEFDGEKMCLTEACEKYGLSVAALRGRLKKGWSIKDALLTPVGIEQVEIKGKLMSISDISKTFSIPASVIRHRVRAGWSADRIISPTRKYSNPCE